MKKTINFADAYSTLVPMYALITAAITAAEREFNVEVLPNLNKITEPKRTDEYMGKEISQNAEMLRKYMGVFCDSQVPGCTFNFWRFTVEIEDDDFNQETWSKMLEYV